ncbi:MAG: hypothetical protein ACKVY0_01800 [Prosthecobacter sp.]
MKTFLAALVLMTTPAMADLTTHAIFKHYIGTWTLEGVIKHEQQKTP